MSSNLNLLTYVAVDGDWSEWSPWERCFGYNEQDGSISEQCLCRSRSCDQPEPRFGGAQCIGARFQVINCSGELHYCYYYLN